MTASRRDLPFVRLGIPADGVLSRYLQGDVALEPMLGRRAADLDDFCARAPFGAPRRVPAAAAGDALVRAAERAGAPDAVLDNARAVAAGDAHVVVTGQQPGLLGGPLYTLHKAATAVRLARDLTARGDRGRVVPLFWNHSDDHDWDEVNRAFVVNPNQDLHKFRLDHAHDGEAVRAMHVGDQVEEVVAAAMDMLPDTEFREQVLDLFRPSGSGATLGEALTRLLTGLFGDHGLVVIEPRDLPREAFDVLADWWRQRPGAGALRDVVHRGVAALGEVGLTASVDPQTTMMFWIGADGRRVALADDAPVPEVSAEMSPGALLRPVWQDAVLPTVGFVVGPGELAYLTVVGRVYEHLGVPRPVLVPRASLTLVEPSLQKLLERFGRDVPDLVDGPESLREGVDDGTDDDVEGVLDALTDDLEKRLKTVASSVKKTDASLVGAVERVRKKTGDEVAKLRNRLHNARQNRLGTGARQARRVCAHLLPKGGLQERTLCALPWLVMHGQGLADVLVEQADPFATGHGVVTL